MTHSANAVSEYYQANFCEENIWHLCQKFPEQHALTSVVFISNPGRQVCLYHQRACPSPTTPVVWDYHVVLLVRPGDNWQVWDLDSRLGAPVCAIDYVTSTFPNSVSSTGLYKPLFRLIPASQYIRDLNTNREHMKIDGKWLSPPPPWPIIGNGNNLMQFVDMSDNTFGEVIDLSAFKDRFAREGA